MVTTDATLTVVARHRRDVGCPAESDDGDDLTHRRKLGRDD